MTRTPTTIVLAAIAAGAIAFFAVRVAAPRTEETGREPLITGALVTTANGMTVFRITTSRPARLRLLLVPSSGLPYDDIVLGRDSPGLVTEWRTTMRGIHFARNYDIRVEATDAQGRTAAKAVRTAAGTA